MRESLFNILAHGIDDFSIDGARVIDLFAGTGALGLEAISRGAAFCLFVDSERGRAGADPHQYRGVRADGRNAHLPPRCHRPRAGRHRGAVRLAFLDPPYGKGLGERALAAWRDGNWLAPGAIVVLEERAGAEIALPPAFAELDRRTYGDTQILIARYAAPRPAPAASGSTAGCR